MKKLSFIFLVAILFSLTTLGQIKITSAGWVMVDYTSGEQALTFGDNTAGTGYPPRGKWAIKHWNNGLNFFIPWPNAAIYGNNYKIFLQDNTGYLGLNNGNP